MSGHLSSVTLKYTNKEQFQTFREATLKKRELQQGRACDADPYIKDENGFFVVYWSSDE